MLVEDDDPRTVVDGPVGVGGDRLRQDGAAQAGRDRGGQRDHHLQFGCGEPGLVGVPQEGRGAPIDAVDDEGDAQLVTEAVGLLGPVPDGAGQFAVGVDAGRPRDPATVGEEGPFVDVLDDVLVVGEP